MQKRSNTLLRKIEESLGHDNQVAFKVDSTLQEMVNIASSNARFDSQDEFRKYLTEGVMLNINKIASTYIGIPAGEYVIYDLNNAKATLIPTALATVQETDFGKTNEHYEVFTRNLLSIWNKAERALVEGPDNLDDPKWRSKLPNQALGNKEKVQNSDSNSKYPRSPETKAAIAASGKSQEAIAQELNVSPSTVSRWTAQTGEGARLPSIKHAMELANATGTDIEAMFGDDQGPPSSERKKKGNKGSGGGRNEAFKQGTPNTQ